MYYLESFGLESTFEATKEIAINIMFFNSDIYVWNNVSGILLSLIPLMNCALRKISATETLQSPYD